MQWKGVRISWLILARNTLLLRLACSASMRAARRWSASDSRRRRPRGKKLELPHHRDAEQQQALEDGEPETDPAVLRDRGIARRHTLVPQVRGADREIVQRPVQPVEPRPQPFDLSAVQARHRLAAERAIGVRDEGVHLLDRRGVAGLLAHRLGGARMVDQADPAHEDVVAQLQQLRIGRDAVVELDLDLAWCCTLFGTYNRVFGPVTTSGPLSRTRIGSSSSR